MKFIVDLTRKEDKSLWAKYPEIYFATTFLFGTTKGRYFAFMLDEESKKEKVVLYESKIEREAKK